ncbi:MAG: hypothetical protein ACOC56_04480 [Atribacterota bacterium]
MLWDTEIIVNETKILHALHNYKYSFDYEETIELFSQVLSEKIDQKYGFTTYKIKIEKLYNHDNVNIFTATAYRKNSTQENLEDIFIEDVEQMVEEILENPDSWVVEGDIE